MININFLIFIHNNYIGADGNTTSGQGFGIDTKELEQLLLHQRG
jgi:hypothetical protein